MYHVMTWVLLCVRAILGLAEAVSTLESQVDAKASADDLSTLQSQVTQAIGQLDTKAAVDDLTALQTVVNALPTAEDVATKAATRDVTALQAQQAINSAAVTALESHGTEGAHIRMIARLNAHDAHRACMFRTCSGYVGDY
jgi:hypothetical protein